MAEILYATVTNTFARSALTKDLLKVVAATTDLTKKATVPPTNYLTLPVEKAEKLVNADPTFVQVAPGPDEKTKYVMATQAGIDAASTAAPIVATPKPVNVAGLFKIETGVPMPAIKRGGERTQMYPFDQLGIQQSFFVPISDEMPNPGKTLASTVSSATRRHKGSTPVRVFTIRANEDEFPTGTVNNPTGATPGRKGARIWRIEPKDATPEQAEGSDPTASA